MTQFQQLLHQEPKITYTEPGMVMVQAINTLKERLNDAPGSDIVGICEGIAILAKALGPMPHIRTKPIAPPGSNPPWVAPQDPGPTGVGGGQVAPDGKPYVTWNKTPYE